MRVLKPILLAIALAAYSRAQTSTGRIAGTVTDPSGAFVKGATVTIINGRTNEGRSTITNDDGNYVFTALEPSAYTLTASMSGFSGVKITDLNLQVGQELRRNLELTVSSNTAVVDVEGGAISAVDASSAKIGVNVSEREVAQLPLKRPPGIAALSSYSRGS